MSIESYYPREKQVMNEFAAAFDSIVELVRQGKTGYTPIDLEENLLKHVSPYTGPLLEPAIYDLLIDDGFTHFAFIDCDAESILQRLDKKDTFSYNIPFLRSLGESWKDQYSPNNGWKKLVPFKNSKYATRNLFLIAEKICLCMKPKELQKFLPVITAMLYAAYDFQDFNKSKLAFPFTTPNIENHQYRDTYRLSDDNKRAGESADKLALLSKVFHESLNNPFTKITTVQTSSEETQSVNLSKQALIKEFLTAVLFTVLLFKFDFSAAPFTPLSPITSPHSWDADRISCAKHNVFIFEMCHSNLAQALWGEYTDEEFESGAFLESWYQKLCSIVSETRESSVAGSSNKFSYEKNILLFNFFAVRRIQNGELPHSLSDRTTILPEILVRGLFETHPKVMQTSDYVPVPSLSEIIAPHKSEFFEWKE